MGSLGDGLVCAAPQRGEGERLLEAGTRGAAPPTPNLPGDTLTCDHEGGDLLLKTGHMDVTVPLTRLSPSGRSTRKTVETGQTNSAGVSLHRV